MSTLKQQLTERLNTLRQIDDWADMPGSFASVMQLFNERDRIDKMIDDRLDEIRIEGGLVGEFREIQELIAKITNINVREHRSPHFSYYPIHS